MCSSSMRAHTGAFGFKRAAPFSYVDKTGWCYLLQVLAHTHTHTTINLLTHLPVLLRMLGRARSLILASNYLRGYATLKLRLHICALP